MAYHPWEYTARFRTGYRADRRTALQLLGTLAVGAAAWGVTETIGKTFTSPGSRRRFTGSHERDSFVGYRFPSTSWINDDPKPIDPSSWNLNVDGEVREPLVLSYYDLLQGGRFQQIELVATLDCTGGWYSTQCWSGVRVIDLCEAAGMYEGARSLTLTGVIGYSRRMPISDAANLLLATHVGDEPLSHRHGAPVRLVAPDRRGFQWVKWVTLITVNSSPAWLQLPFPIE